MKYQTQLRIVFAVTFAIQVLHGETAMRPGLWEQTVTVKTQSGQMEKAMSDMDKQMASMPPEQRKMMEKMMASKGIGKTSKANTLTMCISKEKKKKNYVSPSEGRCRQEIIQKSGNTIHIKFSCTGNPPSSGEGEYIFVNNTAYKGKLVMRTTTQGHTEVIQMNQSGKWLSDNCGNIKPVKH